MSKKLAKKHQPVGPVVAKELARTAKNFGYEEMLSELKAIVADTGTRLAESEATAQKQVTGCGVNASPGLRNPTTSINYVTHRPDKTRQHRIRHNIQNRTFIWPCSS